MSNAIRVKIKLALIFHFTCTSNEKWWVEKLSMYNKKSRCSIKIINFLLSSTSHGGKIISTQMIKTTR